MPQIPLKHDQILFAGIKKLMLLIKTVESISMIFSVIYAFQYLIFTSLSS